MGIVANTDLVKQAVGRWEASDIAFIRSFGFESCDGPNFDLVLLTLLQPRPPLSAGWPDPDGPFWEIAIAFERVRNLSLIVEGPWDIQSEGFVIEDISTWQWEGVRLRVHDYEEGPYRFDAWSATIRSCVPAHRGPGCPAISRVYPGVYPEGRGRRLL